MPVNIRSRTALALGGTGLLTLVSYLLFNGGPLNYDAQWSLDWGAAITRGETPEYDVDGAPTPHPLTTLISAGLELTVGDATSTILHVLAHAAHAMLVVVAVLLAAELFSWAAGAIAGIVIALCAPISETTAVAFQDPATAALLLLAVLLDVRGSDRPARPLIVLGVAGLLRPEVWGVAAAYWLWSCARRPWPDRLRFGVLAAAGPLVWMLSDLVISGEPLLSFTRTRAGAELAARTTGLAEGPGQLVAHLRTALDEPIIAGALAGGALVLLAHWQGRRTGSLGAAAPVARLAARGQLTLLALGGLLVAAFLVLAAGELSLLERYVVGLMGVFAILFGFGVTGWRGLERGRVRSIWLLGSVAVVAGTLAFAPRQVDRVDRNMGFIKAEGDVIESLASLADDPMAREAMDRCPIVAVYSYRVRPYLAYELDRRPSSLPISLRAPEARLAVAWVTPATDEALRVFALRNIRGESVPTAPPGFRRAARTRSWNLFTRGC